jgi:peptidyl-prolyl cis-trans isomerase SurA
LAARAALSAPRRPWIIAMRASCSRPAPFRRAIAALALAVALLLPGAARAQVVVIANGSPITEFDIAQRIKLIATSTHKNPTRQQVIDELIDDRLKIARAGVYGLHVTDEQVNAAFDNMAKRQGVSVKQFDDVLTRAGIAPEAVKARIRAELTWNELIRGKFGPSLQVSDADVAKVLAERHETDAAEVGFIYTLYPITIVVPPGSSQAVIEAKRHEADNLRSRFATCKDGLVLARALRDVAVREPISRASGDLPKPTRDVLASLPIGHLTTPDVTSLGLQMFALCDKKQTSQESPLKTQVREEIYAKRFEAQSKQYLAEIRKQAMIEYKNQ